jgi:hypothetical protein
MRPGTYDMPETVYIQATKNSTIITIEKMELPETIFDATMFLAPPPECSCVSFENKKHGLVSCPEFLDDMSMSESEDFDEPQENDVVLQSAIPCLKRNTPLFRVSRGGLVLRNIRLLHKSMGVAIWSGNAAIHVEVRQKEGTTASKARASAVLEHCEITSSTGRGIVISTGGEVGMKNCYIHNCAATGIYVGGSPESKVRLDTIDITYNGNGNQAGGISRSHSGICLEFGQIEILNSNISFNTASGISLVWSQEVKIMIKDSDLIGNGLMPLDTPFDARVDDAGVFPLLHNISVQGNRMLPRGCARPRSTLTSIVSSAHYPG